MGTHVAKQYRPNVYVAERYLDLRLPAFAHTAGALPFTVTGISVPAESIVLNAGYEVVTASTGTGTGAISDGTTTFVTATALSAAGYKTLGATQKVFATSDTLDLVIATVIGTDSVVRLFATIVDVEDRPRPVAAS
jgi:hypothetical protein